MRTALHLSFGRPLPSSSIHFISCIPHRNTVDYPLRHGQFYSVHSRVIHLWFHHGYPTAHAPSRRGPRSPGEKSKFSCRGSVRPQPRIASCENPRGGSGELHDKLAEYLLVWPGGTVSRRDATISLHAGLSVQKSRDKTKTEIKLPEITGVDCAAFCHGTAAHPIFARGVFSQRHLHFVLDDLVVLVIVTTV